MLLTGTPPPHPQSRTAPHASPYRRCPRQPRLRSGWARGCACSASRWGSGRRRSRGFSGRSCLHQGPSSGTLAAVLTVGVPPTAPVRAGGGEAGGTGAVRPSAHGWEGLRHRPWRGGACEAPPPPAQVSLGSTPSSVHHQDSLSVLGLNCGPSCMLSNHSTTELHTPWLRLSHPLISSHSDHKHLSVIPKSRLEHSQLFFSTG